MTQQSTYRGFRCGLAMLVATSAFAETQRLDAGGISVDAETIAGGLQHPWGLEFLPDGTMLVATIPTGNTAGARWTAEPLALKEFPNGRIKSFIWALGEDAAGELYVLANGMNSAFGTRGNVFKLVPQ